MGGGASTNVSHRRDDIPSAEDLQQRYQLKNRIQGKGLKRLLERLAIPIACVEKVFKTSTQNGIDIASDVCSKRDFLVAVDIGEGPFPIGALNTLGVKEKIDFIDFFATLYNYCTLDHDQLLAFTFKFTNFDGSGYLSLEELTTLVHYVYGTNVAKSEAGFIVTRNHTDHKTAQLVMKSCDPSNTGRVSMQQFTHGMKRHANLLNPAFQTQLELRRVLGGPKFWKKETKRLTELCKEEKVSLVAVHNEVRKMMAKAELAEDGCGERANVEWQTSRSKWGGTSVSLTKGARAFKHSTKPGMSSKPWETTFVSEQPDALMKADYLKRRSGSASDDQDAKEKSPGPGGSRGQTTSRAKRAALHGAASFKENVAQQQKKRQQPVIMMYE